MAEIKKEQTILYISQLLYLDYNLRLRLSGNKIDHLSDGGTENKNPKYTMVSQL